MLALINRHSVKEQHLGLSVLTATPHYLEWVDHQQLPAVVDAVMDIEEWADTLKLPTAPAGWVSIETVLITSVTK